jgi:hypothetical protein
MLIQMSSRGHGDTVVRHYKLNSNANAIQDMFTQTNSNHLLSRTQKLESKEEDGSEGTGLSSHLS